MARIAVMCAGDNLPTNYRELRPGMPYGSKATEPQREVTAIYNGHGVLAPNAKLHSAVVPGRIEKASERACEHAPRREAPEVHGRETIWADAGL